MSPAPIEKGNYEIIMNGYALKAIGLPTQVDGNE